MKFDARIDVAAFVSSLLTKKRNTISQRHMCINEKRNHDQADSPGALALFDGHVLTLRGGKDGCGRCRERRSMVVCMDASVSV